MENSKGVLLGIFGIIIGFFWLIGYTNEKSLDYHYTAETPNWLRIWIWISLIAMLLAVIWLTME